METTLHSLSKFFEPNKSGKVKCKSGDLSPAKNVNNCKWQFKNNDKDYLVKAVGNSDKGNYKEIFKTQLLYVINGFTYQYQIINIK